MLLECHRTEFVTLGEDDRKRNLALSQLDEEVHIDLSYVVTAVDQDKEHHHLLREVDVVSDDLLELLLCRAGHLCVAVAREVHQVPLSVYEEVVHQSGLSWLAGCHSQLLVAAQHIDEGRLAHIGSSDEGEFREFLFRLLGDSGAAAGE